MIFEIESKLKMNRSETEHKFYSLFLNKTISVKRVSHECQKTVYYLTIDNFLVGSFHKKEVELMIELLTGNEIKSAKNATKKLDET